MLVQNKKFVIPFLTGVFLFISLSLIAVNTSHASMSGFSVTSKNGSFKAKVIKSEDKNKWYLRVYNKEKLFWEREYFNFRMQGGLLSNDGKAFVYIDYAYKDPPIRIFRANRAGTENIGMSKINFNKTKVVKMGLNRQWLHMGSFPELVEEQGKSVLKFKTIDGKNHKIRIAK